MCVCIYIYIYICVCMYILEMEKCVNCSWIAAICEERTHVDRPPLHIYEQIYTSAPSPKRYPSAKRDEALWKTLAESTVERNISAVAAFLVTITSVWAEPSARGGEQVITLRQSGERLPESRCFVENKRLLCQLSSTR